MNVNCMYCDKYGACEKKPRVFGLFKRQCVLTSLESFCEDCEPYLDVDHLVIQEPPMTPDVKVFVQ